ncbi:MAG: hypothetical protein DRI24_23855 [Deltaproteobacteria bacterium]|nr:MAG: hypothetical protein DRI24_23855 [Deltaproteobacteria bacterium]
MHDDLFDAFAEQVIVTDKDGVRLEVDAVLSFGVEAVDDFNEVVERVDKASFRTSEYTYKRGDIMEITSEVWAGLYELGKRLESNGFVSGFEITRNRNA